MPENKFGSVGKVRQLASALATRANMASTAGITFVGQRDLFTALGYKRDLEPKDFRDRYKRNAIAGRVVDALPKATWRGEVEINEDEDPEMSTAFEEAWLSIAVRLNVFNVFLRSDILTGLGRYSVILIGATGELDTELPSIGGPDGILYLSTFGEEDVSVETIISDTADPRFGLPETYKFKRISSSQGKSSGGSQEKEVHWTRVIHVADGLLDELIFGIPRMERSWNLLDDLEKVTGSGSEAFWLRTNQGVQFNVDKDLEMSTDDVTDLKDQIDEYVHGIRRVMRTRGMDINVLGSDIANFSNQVDAILTQIAGGTGIPKRILLGSEMGELASSQDRTNWLERIDDRRLQYAEPQVIRQFIDRLIEFNGLPTPISYSVRWPQQVLSDENQRSQIASRLADLNKKIGGIIILPSEIRDRVLMLPPLPEGTAAPSSESVPEEEDDETETLDPEELSTFIQMEKDLRVAKFSFVDTPSKKEPWQDIHEVADRHNGRVARATFFALKAGSKEIPVKIFAQALKENDKEVINAIIDRAMKAFREEYTETVPPLLVATLLDGGTTAGQTAKREGDLRTAQVTLAFDRTNPLAITWANSYSAIEVVKIERATRLAIRNIIASSFELQRTIPATTALIRAQLVIAGAELAPNFSFALNNAYARLMNARNFGKTVLLGKTKAHIPIGGMTGKEANILTQRYGERLSRYRARMIARTETIAASNEGQRQLWLQAERDGLLQGNEAREWIFTPDKRSCPICSQMSGVLVPINKPFVLPTGVAVMGPPAHPQCRCSVGLTSKPVSASRPTPWLNGPPPPVVPTPTPVGTPTAPPIPIPPAAGAPPEYLYADDVVRANGNSPLMESEWLAQQTDDLITLKGSNSSIDLAIDEYTGDPMNFNRPLWGTSTETLSPDFIKAGFAEFGDDFIREATKNIQVLQDLVKNQARKIPDGTVVFRGAGKGLDKILANSEVGDILEMTGFQSTSLSPQHATNFGRNFMFEIKNARGYYVEGLAEESEFEFLLAHGAKFRIDRLVKKVKYQGFAEEPVEYTVVQVTMI